MSTQKPHEILERIEALAKEYSAPMRKVDVGTNSNSGGQHYGGFKAGYIAALQDPLVIALRDASLAVTNSGRSTFEERIDDLCEVILNFDQALASLKGER